MKEMTVFAKRLEYYALEHELKYSEISRITGIHPNTLYSYLYHGHNPAADKIIKICKALNLSADYMLGLRDTP